METHAERASSMYFEGLPSMNLSSQPAWLRKGQWTRSAAWRRVSALIVFVQLPFRTISLFFYALFSFPMSLWNGKFRLHLVCLCLPVFMQTSVFVQLDLDNLDLFPLNISPATPGCNRLFHFFISENHKLHQPQTSPVSPKY